MRTSLEWLCTKLRQGHYLRMSQAFIRESGGTPIVRSTRESADNTAGVYRTIEPGYDFIVREGRGGYMIARLDKDGRFDSWVEE